MIPNVNSLFRNILFTNFSEGNSVTIFSSVLKKQQQRQTQDTPGSCMTTGRRAWNTSTAGAQCSGCLGALYPVLQGVEPPPHLHRGGVSGACSACGQMSGPPGSGQKWLACRWSLYPWGTQLATPTKASPAGLRRSGPQLLLLIMSQH